MLVDVKEPLYSTIKTMLEKSFELKEKYPTVQTFVNAACRNQFNKDLKSIPENEHDIIITEKKTIEENFRNENNKNNKK